MTYVYVDTNIDFSAPVLQTADLRAALVALQTRKEKATTCLYCEMSIVPNPAKGSPLEFIHADDRKDVCEDLKPVAPADDELDDWDEEILSRLKELDKALDGGLSQDRSLINDDCFEQQVRDEAEEQVPEFIRTYVDWEGYAAAQLAAHTTVEIDKAAGYGSRVYHYAG